MPLRLALSLASVLLALGIGEAAFRLVFHDVPGSIRFKQGMEVMYGRPVTGLDQILRPDPELFWSLRPSTRLPADTWPFRGVIANGEGLREEQEIGTAKPEGQIRLLFLGDSCTFGYGVTHDEAFVDQVERALHANRRDRRVECINSGVPGYSLFQGWRYLETRGLLYQPDLVVLCFGWNDMNDWDGLGDRQHYELLRRSSPPSALSRSRIAQITWSALFAQRPDNAEPRPRLTPEEYRDLLGVVGDRLERDEIPLVLMNWGFRLQLTEMKATATAHQYQMRGFARERSLPLVDLVPVFDRMLHDHSAQDVFIDGGHVTPLGHAAVAEALVGVLDAWLAGYAGAASP